MAGIGKRNVPLPIKADLEYRGDTDGKWVLTVYGEKTRTKVYDDGYEAWAAMQCATGLIKPLGLK